MAAAGEDGSGRPSGRRPRPAARARRLQAPPATELSPRLVAVCATGERAVTVIARRDGAAHAALGSPAEPEAFAVWRAQGVYVFLAGDLPHRLDLDLGAGARVEARTAW